MILNSEKKKKQNKKHLKLVTSQRIKNKEEKNLKTEFQQ